MLPAGVVDPLVPSSFLHSHTNPTSQYEQGASFHFEWVKTPHGSLALFGSPLSQLVYDKIFLSHKSTN